MTTDQISPESLQYAKGDLEFAAWLDQVNRGVEDVLGFSIHDLPDRTYRCNYDDGLEPANVATDVLREQGL